jgi:hypothetical protein
MTKDPIWRRPALTALTQPGPPSTDRFDSARAADQMATGAIGRTAPCRIGRGLERRAGVADFAR